MVRIPVDLSGLSFIAGSDPEGVLDMDRKPRADKETGELLWGLDVVVLGLPDGAEVWNVRVVGEPKGTETGGPLRVQGLTAMTWEIEGRHGVSFRARLIEPTNKSKPASAAAA